MKKEIIIFIIAILYGTFISAIDYPSTSITITYGGNLTNISEMQDVNVPSPNDNDVLTWDDATKKWIAQAVASLSKWIIGSSPYWYNNSNTVYFNETALNITIDARATGLGDNASWNQSFADTLYASIGTTDNSSWNESHANTLYYSISNPENYINLTTGAVLNETDLINAVNDSLITNYYTKTEADTNLSLYLLLTDGRYNETAWVLAQGYITSGIENNTGGWIINFTKIYSDDWTNVTITESQITDLQSYLTSESDPAWTGNQSSYYNKSEVDNNLSLYILTSSLPLENKTIIHCANITGSASDLCTITSSADGVGYNSSTINSSELENQGDDKLGIIDSFIDTLIDNRVTQAFIKALGFYDTTEIYNKSEIDTNLSNYYLLSNPSNYWNDTSSGFNKTYADTLYAPIGTTDNASWNQSFANTLYAPNTTTGIQYLINATGVYSTYNDTYAGLINNASYLSTYNATYHTWAYNQTTATFNLYNSTWDNRGLINSVNTTGNIQGLINNTNLNLTSLTIGGATMTWNGTHLIIT